MGGDEQESNGGLTAIPKFSESHYVNVDITKVAETHKTCIWHT